MTCPTSTATPAASNASTPLAIWSPDGRLGIQPLYWLDSDRAPTNIATAKQYNLTGPRVHVTLCYTFRRLQKNPHVRQGAESHGSHAEVEHRHGSTELLVEVHTPPPLRGCDDPIICLCRCVDLHRGKRLYFQQSVTKEAVGS